jgi:urea carboxylase
VRTEDTVFDLAAHRRFLADDAASIADFRTRQQAAFAEERERWRASGEFDRAEAAAADEPLPADAPPPGAALVAAPMAARVGSVAVGEGDPVAPGDQVAVLEAMKMEVAVHTEHGGTVAWLGCRPGQVVTPGQPLVGVTP